MPAPRSRTVTLLGATIVTAIAGAAVAVLGDPAAGVVLVALSVAIAGTALRHRYRKDHRR